MNPRALAFAEVNASLAERPASLARSDVLDAVEGAPDLIVSNPPFMKDAGARTYREGGGAHGEALSLRILREAVARLVPGGTLLLYTGAPIVDGRDAFLQGARPLLGRAAYTYEELDVDVFGEALEEPANAGVERIAAVGLRVRRTSR